MISRFLKGRPAALTPEQHAARWLLRFQHPDMSDDERAAFDRWRMDERNALAYDKVSTVWNAVDLLRDDPALRMSRARSLRALQREPVRRRSLIVAACATLALALVGIGLVKAPWLGQATEASGLRYQTLVGQRSIVTLDDGSVVTLNTDSVVDVEYGASERAIRLLKGQAYLQVAHGRPAPFVVYSNGQRVVATGTEFDVRLRERETQVTLVTGRVLVDALTPDADVGRAPIELRPGQRLVAAPGRPARVSLVDVDEVQSWRSGRIALQNMTLGEAVAEVNRYTRKPLTLDPAVRGLDVSGVFVVGQTAQFARAIAEIHPLTLEYRPDGSIHIGRPRG